jgi:putative membrane protein
MSVESTPPKLVPPPALPAKRDVAVLAAKGAVIGVAEAIPGVSGGTVALILGVYTRLIEAIKSYTPRSVIGWLKALPGASSVDGRPVLVEQSRGLHFDFLIPLGIGMAPAFLVGTKILPRLLEEHRALMQALFFGMILASVYVPFQMVRGKTVVHYVLIAVGTAAAWQFIGLSQTVTPNPLFVFIFAAFAICALVLPGVSGSYLLHSVGLYTHISGALHESFDPVTLGAFALGAVTGLVTSVRVLSWLLKKYRGSTLAVLTGLMIGSLRSVWFFQQPTGETRMVKGVAKPIYENIMPASFGGDEMTAIAVAVFGAAIVLGLIVADKKLSPSVSEDHEDAAA